jgi:hypothetical protein
MRLAASSAPVAVKRRAVEPVYTVKIFPVFTVLLVTAFKDAVVPVI